MKKPKIIFILLLTALFPLTGRAQKVGIKTNLIHDAILNPNLGVEIGVAPKWTLDITGQMNLWTINGHKWKHWLAQPEARYWFCERFAGHFLGLHALGGQFNVGNLRNSVKFLGTDFSKLTDRRYQGWAAGVGIGYGYAWPLSKHWSIEAEIGIGWVYTKSDSYPCATCGNKIDKKKVHNYVGPTKEAVSIVYVF